MNNKNFNNKGLFLLLKSTWFILCKKDVIKLSF